MDRDYIQVRPSREKINPDDVIEHISALHDLKDLGETQKLRGKLNPLVDSSPTVPSFTFLCVSHGQDRPIEFYYGTDPESVDSLEQGLVSAYPDSFDVDRVSIDVLNKIVPPERYTPEDFVKKLEDGELQFDPDTEGTEEDITGEHTAKTKPADQNDTEQNTSDSPGDINHSRYTKGDYSLQVDRISEQTKPSSPEDAVDQTGTAQTLDPEDIDGFEMLEEIGAGLLDTVALPEDLRAEQLEQRVDQPTWTPDGDILARPTLEHGTTVAVRWNGVGERKRDWMTTLKMFSKVAEPGAEDIDKRAPLARLIQHLARADLPIALQCAFERFDDWTKRARRRKNDIHRRRDTLWQKIQYELRALTRGNSQDRIKEQRRDYFDRVGESANGRDDSPVGGDVADRRRLIDNKILKRTFRVNMRAVSVAASDVDVEDVEGTMENVASVLNHLAGYFYRAEPDILKDDDGFRKSTKAATEEFHRLISRDIASGSGKKRPDMIMNADELANFITIRSAESLTVEGVQGTWAEAEARDPLPKPDPDLMSDFHKPGMRIGYAMDSGAEPEPVQTQIPPDLLTQHYARFGTTGSGKSKALSNDMLSLHENTSGPTILIDPKGDGMPENYMKSHFERFGEEDSIKNVINFPIPDVLPGFTFFNINSALESGQRRRDAIQNKADHYQELLKLVIGREKYEDLKVAPTMISALD